jgi:hypothetical protein
MRPLSPVLSLALAACASSGIPAGIPAGMPATSEPLPALAPARGAVQFACDFEHSPTDCGFFEQAKVPGRATLVPVARTGRTAVRLHTEPGDNRVNGSDDWERNDLALSPEATDCAEGKQAWWAHSVLFPDDYVDAPGGATIMDFHHTGSRGNANFHFNAMRTGLRLHGFGGSRTNPVEYRVELGPLRRNLWYDLVYHVRWSSGTDGFMRAWINGKKVLAYSGPTLYRGMQCYLKLANYHSPTPASSVIHDRVLRGTSARAVALTPLEGEPH